MPAKKYSEADISALASRDYKSLDAYQRRLVRGHNRGLSRTQAVGHPAKKETPLSKQRNTPTLVKGTGKVAHLQAAKATPSQPKRQLGQASYIKNIYSKDGKNVGQRIQARSYETLQKQFDRLPDSASILITLIDTRSGAEVKVVGKHTAGNTISVGDLRARIAAIQADTGATWQDAFTEALAEEGYFYEVSGEDGVFENATRFVMYTLY